MIKDLRQANACKGNSSVSTQIQTELQFINFQRYRRLDCTDTI